MAVVWVKSNRRALAMGMVLPGAILAAGLAVFAWWVATPPPRSILVLMASIAAAVLGVVGILALMREMTRPRLSYANGALRVHLTNGLPEEVPIEFVECFFRGQAPAMVKDRAGNEPEVATVIVRIAERAADYRHRDVKAALGHWCEGYITLRGTWCETIDNDQLLQLNRQLVAAQREHKASHTKSERGEPAESHS